MDLGYWDFIPTGTVPVSAQLTVNDTLIHVMIRKGESCSPCIMFSLHSMWLTIKLSRMSSESQDAMQMPHRDSAPTSISVKTCQDTIY